MLILCLLLFCVVYDICKKIVTLGAEFILLCLDYIYQNYTLQFDKEFIKKSLSLLKPELRLPLEKQISNMDYHQILFWASSMQFLEIMQELDFGIGSGFVRTYSRQVGKEKPKNFTQSVLANPKCSLSEVIKLLLADAQDICHCAILNFPVKNVKGNL